ncbi:MAG: extracellular solute-binding protein [Phycisphaerales bacterium]|nr:extracellular solute-binding protein [Phycisphaerales bacterium]MCB9855590.1 extracellular solute-binding protein [Phycisphaerales bacterium]MCB9864921.1 extracellular solute-binding protein [Phycisphaerales bacterium]
MDPMIAALGKALRFSMRSLIALIALALVLWAFYWVLSRPFRRKALNPNQIELSVIHWGENNEDAIVADLVRDFEAQNPDIRISRTNLGQAAAVNTKLQTMFAAGDPPDVFYLGYEKVADFASKDLLADLQPLIDEDIRQHRETVDLSDYFPAALRAYEYNEKTQLVGSGKLIALPKDFTTVGFYYNIDLLRRAGVEPPSPDGWTWDEFHDAAQKVAKLPGCYGADFVTWEAMMRMWVWTHGERFADPDWQTFHLEDPDVRATLKKLQSWFHDETRTLVSAKTQLETGLEPFLAGNVGFAGPFGRWKVPTYRLIDDFKWDIAPLPHAKDSPPANGIMTAAWAIARQSPNKEAAWRFVKYMNSVRGQTRMCEAGLAIPVLKSVAYSDAFKQEGQSPKNWRVYLDAEKCARVIDWPIDPNFMQQFRLRLEDIYKQNKSVDTATARVAAEWRANGERHRRELSYPHVDWLPVTLWIVLPIAFCIGLTAFLWWRRRSRGIGFQEELAGTLMVSPWLIGFAAFTAFPVVMSLLLSFMHWSGMAPLDTAKWVGLDNFRSLYEDAGFRHSLKITAIYALLAVPTGQLVALIAAMLLAREWRSIGVFRAIWYLPSVLAGVGMAIMWKWVFDWENGLLNALISPIWIFGDSPPHWLEKDADFWGVPVFAMINLWAMGGAMMVFLAGIKGIPKHLYEAADIDGAVGWHKFFNVTLPMLSPVILFNAVIAIITSFQVFTQAYVMTGGGPGDATRFYVVSLYNRAFDLHEMGYASAMAWLLLVIILVLTMLLMWGSRKFVYYEALK